MSRWLRSASDEVFPGRHRGPSVGRGADVSRDERLSNLDISMDPIEEPPHGPGDEDDEGPGMPWLPPDDRLWRHPSEVRANPPAPPPPPARNIGSWFRETDPRSWLVGAISGVVAALVCALVLMAAGAVDRPSTVVSVSTVANTPVSGSTGSGPSDGTAILDSVEPAVVGLTWSSDSGVENGSGVVVYSNGAHMLYPLR